MTVDYPDYQTPQANADAISTTGAPALNLNGVILNTTGVLAANGTFTSAGLPINQPGFEARVQLTMPASTITALPIFQFDWDSTATSSPSWPEQWCLAAGSAAVGPNTWLGRGKAMGNQLIVRLINEDSINSLTYTIQLYQTSQYTSRTEFRKDIFSSFSIPSHAVCDFRDDHLLLGTHKNGSIPSGSTDVTVLPPGGCRVYLHFETGSNANDAEITITDLNPQVGASFSVVYDKFTDSTGNLNDELALPQSHMQITMTNHNAAAHALSYAFTRIET